MSYVVCLVPSMLLVGHLEGHLSLSFSLSDGHFPGGSGLATTRSSPFWILLELSMMEVLVCLVFNGTFTTNRLYRAIDV